MATEEGQTAQGAENTYRDDILETYPFPIKFVVFMAGKFHTGPKQHSSTLEKLAPMTKFILPVCQCLEIVKLF